MSHDLPTVDEARATLARWDAKGKKRDDDYKAVIALMRAGLDDEAGVLSVQISYAGGVCGMELAEALLDEVWRYQEEGVTPARVTRTMTCEYCHGKFEATRPDARYCSPKHRVAAHRARARAAAASSAELDAAAARFDAL